MQQKTINKLFFLDKSFLQSEYGLKYILSCFVNFYLVIQLFDISRNALLLPGIVHALFALVRDVSIFSLLFYLLSSKQYKITSLLLPLLIISLFFPIFLSIGSLLDKVPLVVSISSTIQFTLLALRPFVFLLVLCNLDCFYIFDRDNLQKTFIGFLTFLVIFSFLIYFFYPSLISKYNIENRIGLGNMSVQSGMYLCAYILCLYYFPYKSKFVNWFCVLTLLAGIFLSVCTTGIICTLFVTGLFLIEKKTRKRCMSIILLASIVIIYVIIKYNSILKPFLKFFMGKAYDAIDLILNFFTGNANNKPTQSSSFNTRENQIKNMLQYNNKKIDLLFGHGYFSASSHENMVENGYYDLYFSCGIFGVFLLGALYIKVGVKSIRMFLKKRSVVGICAFTSLVLFMVTLCITVLPTLSLSFIILFYFLFYKK